MRHCGRARQAELEAAPRASQDEVERLVEGRIWRRALVAGPPPRRVLLSRQEGARLDAVNRHCGAGAQGWAAGGPSAALNPRTAPLLPSPEASSPWGAGQGPGAASRVILPALQSTAMVWKPSE